MTQSDPLAPPAGFADRVVDAWRDARRVRRRRIARAVALAALLPLAFAVWSALRAPVEVELAVRVDRASLPATGGVATLMLTLDAESSDQAPVALAIALDDGPALTGQRLESLRAGLAATRAVLGPEDRLIVTGTEGIIAAGDPLHAYATPCVDCAFDAALVALREAPTTLQRTVVLLTDDGPDRALRAKADAAWREHGVRTAVIGIGGQFPPDAVHGLAISGRGHFYFAHNSSLIGDLLQVELRAARRVALVGARLTAGDAAVDLGRIGGERLVLMPLEVTPEQARAGVSIELTARRVDGRRVVLRRAQRWRITDDPAALAARDPVVVAELARRAAAEALVAALAAREEGHGDAAQAALARGRAAFQRVPAEQRVHFEALAEALRALPDRPVEVATRHRAEAGVLFEMELGVKSANAVNNGGGLFKAMELE